MAHHGRIREFVRPLLDRYVKRGGNGRSESRGACPVYAGSYLLDSRAAFETERLGAAGFALTLKKVEVAIPSKSLSAGSFRDKKTAEAALDKLKAAGINATLVGK